MSKRAVAAIREGRATFEWVAVESTHKAHKATFFLFADALKVDGIREIFTPLTAQEAADLLGAHLPTPKLLDLRYLQADVAADPQPEKYPNSVGMATQAAVAAHSARVDAAVKGAHGVVQNVGKHWVLHPAMTRRKAVLYGWHVPSQKNGKWQGIKVGQSMSRRDLFLIQGPNADHVHAYTDYAMTLMLVHGDCVVDGETMRTADVLRSSSLCELAVGAKPLAEVRLPAAVPTSELESVPPQLARGDGGTAVKRLQTMLINVGFDLDPHGADGDFGELTEKALRDFQKRAQLPVTGIADAATWAALEREPVVPPVVDPFPARPSFSPLTSAARAAMLGSFQYEHAPLPNNRENIRILGSWVADNIVTIEIPQLRAVPGVVVKGKLQGDGPKDGKVQCHRLVAEPLRALWQAWEAAGLLPQNPDLVRAMGSSLHSR